jgi:hypothetical protein
MFHLDEESRTSGESKTIMSSRPASLPKAIGILCLLTIAFGCASVPMTDTSADTQAKQFQPTSGMASVYFVRQSNGFGDTLDEYIHVDGQSVGAVAPNTYILLNVPPGHHTITVEGPTNSEQTQLDATAGNLYFYSVSIKWAGPMIRHRHIEAMSDADGRAAVASTKRAVTNTNPS